jgi:hypothetical protein
MYQLENDTTSLSLDDYYVSFETGLSKRNFKTIDILGDGFNISGNGYLSGRVVKINRSFTKYDYDNRELFIKWYTKSINENIYLRWISTSFEGISQVYPSLQGGENFSIRDFIFSKEINFEMLQPDPYYYSTSLTSVTFIPLSTEILSTFININGQKNYIQIQFTSTLAWTSFELKLNTNYGIHIDYNFEAEDVLVIKTSSNNLSMQVNGIEQYGYFDINSVPFPFESGLNYFDFKGQSGTLILSYYKRVL